MDYFRVKCFFFLSFIFLRVHSGISQFPYLIGIASLIGFVL